MKHLFVIALVIASSLNAHAAPNKLMRIKAMSDQIERLEHKLDRLTDMLDRMDAKNKQDQQTVLDGDKCHRECNTEAFGSEESEEWDNLKIDEKTTARLKSCHKTCDDKYSNYLSKAGSC